MSERRPHAIHNMRSRMRKVSLTATAAGEALSEVARLIGESIDKGQGLFHGQERALQILEGVIADQKFIAVETAVPIFEPGHTQRRGAPTSEPSPQQPLLMRNA